MNAMNGNSSYMHFGLNLHCSMYELSWSQCVLSLLTLSCATYAKRHLELSHGWDSAPHLERVYENEGFNMGEHCIIAVLECIPVLGALIGLVEYVIARYFRSSQQVLCQRLGQPPPGETWHYTTICRKLELDTWESAGDTNLAICRIMRCLKTNRNNLNLSYLHLTALPTAALSYLKHLTSIDCSHNSLDVINISDFPELTYFCCDGNSLEALTLSNLPVLQVARCGWNRLSSLHLTNLRNLVTLNFQYNVLDAYLRWSSLTVRNADQIEVLRPEVWENVSQCSQFCRVNFEECMIPRAEQVRLTQLTQAPGYTGPNLFFGEEPLPLRQITPIVMQATGSRFPENEELHSMMEVHSMMERLTANRTHLERQIFTARRAFATRVHPIPPPVTTDRLSGFLKRFTDHTTDASLKHFKVYELRNMGVAEHLLIAWLEKVLEAKDFMDETTRSHFATRVLKILQFVAQNAGYRQVAEPIFMEATGSCSDRATLGLNALELHMKLCLIPSATLNDVVHLLNGAYVMGILENIARAMVPTLQRRSGVVYVDEIEVYLGLQVRLRETFSLPIDTKEMNHFNCSTLTEQDIERVTIEVKQALTNKKKIVDFFLSQAPLWQEKLDQQFSTDKSDMLARYNDYLETLTDQVGDGTIDEGQYNASAMSITKARSDAEADWYKTMTETILFS